MKRQVISSVLVVSFLWYAGCVSTVPITKEKLLEEKGSREIRVTSKSSKSFRIVNWYTQNDSLFGTPSEKPFSHRVGVPLSEISMMEVQEFDGGKTALAVGVIGVAVALAVVLVNQSLSGFIR